MSIEECCKYKLSELDKANQEIKRLNDLNEKLKFKLLEEKAKIRQLEHKLALDNVSENLHGKHEKLDKLEILANQVDILADRLWALENLVIVHCEADNG